MPPKGLEPSGIILVDKPAGPSSFAVMARVRARMGTKMGHAGTLDPFATGLLLLLSGRSTKLAGSFVGLDKRYLTDVDLTARTTTGDPEGDVVGRQEAPSPDELERALEGLRGEIELPIPAASAVKIGGERAYKLHRRGVEVEMPLRRSRVDALDVIAYTDGIVTLDLRVSSGTYVQGDRGGARRSLRGVAPARGGAVQRRGRRRAARDPRRAGAGAAAVSTAEKPFAVAIGTFDGVHLGHRRVIETALDTGLPVRVLTFQPHPRVVLGNFVEALATLERRLELLAELGVAETTVLEFTLDVAKLEPEDFAAAQLADAAVVVAGEDFRFGRKRRGDLELLERLGYGVLPVPLLEGFSSTEIRHALHEGDVRAAARLLGRPPELDGIVVGGDQRGGTLGYPTANLAVEPGLLVPAYGIYAGAALGHRAAISIGTNPHYGGDERRIEPYLLDFDGDLYGRRLVVELWDRLRDEQVFESEQGLIDQIARDVEATRKAVRPA